MFLNLGIAFISIGFIGGIFLQIKHNTFGIFTSLSSKWNKKDYALSICIDVALGIGIVFLLIHSTLNE